MDGMFFLKRKRTSDLCFKGSRGWKQLFEIYHWIYHHVSHSQKVHFSRRPFQIFRIRRVIHVVSSNHWMAGSGWKVEIHSNITSHNIVDVIHHFRSENVQFPQTKNTHPGIWNCCEVEFANFNRWRWWSFVMLFFLMGFIIMKDNVGFCSKHSDFFVGANLGYVSEVLIVISTMNSCKRNTISWDAPRRSSSRKWGFIGIPGKKCKNPSKIEWDLTNGPLRKLLGLLDTQV